MLPSSFVYIPDNAKVEVATSNGLGGNVFTKEYIICPGPGSHKMLLSREREREREREKERERERERERDRE